ncbi:arginine--tRNA ligase [Candidatus Kaiserbacteria bacterium]|nr:arginine--tRNA ligase [Candidatus Kaiserbacteria bacterium]
MNTAQDIKQAIARALENVGIPTASESIMLEHPAELSRGDYATNVAMQAFGRIAKSQNQYHKDDTTVPKIKTGNFVLDGFKNPEQLAEKLVATMGNIEGVSSIVAVKPGFINFTLASQTIAASLDSARTQDMWGNNEMRAGQKIMVEYTQPNPFKEFHIGHLMGNVNGESIARLMQYVGAEVLRVNYQGDVGVHVACAIWGIKKLDIDPSTADEFGQAYSTGAMAYKADPQAKNEIDEINKKVYDRSDPEINTLYDAGRKKSLEAFERIYVILGTTFDHYFFESETGPIGKEIVLAHPDIFPESDGARIFRGEEYGLHTRVFINATGLPTYEAKEIGLQRLKKDLYPDTTLLIIETANEIDEYFKVIHKVLELIYPDIAAQMKHVSHGLMKLSTGKMSSRTGNVITGESLLNELAEAAKARAAESRADDTEKLAEQIAVAAIKYQILKQGSGKDIVFDRERALSLEGDSGPYLQYAYARTNAIIAKAHEQGIVPMIDQSAMPSEVTRLIHRFPEIVEHASHELESHIVTQYLTHLASSFNSWYAQEQILDGTPAAAHKVAIVEAVNRTLKNGLWILGITAPEKM